MGGWGYIYAAFLVPSVILCLMSHKYALLGFIMAGKWMLFTIPVRSNFPNGDSPFYFAAVVTIAAILIYRYCDHLKAGRIILWLLGMSLIFAYFPQALEYVNLHTTMVVSEVFGYLQIIVLCKFGGGHVFRRTLGRFKLDMVDSGNSAGWYNFYPRVKSEAKAHNTSFSFNPIVSNFKKKGD